MATDDPHFDDQVSKSLTRRELDILALLAENLSDREIADRLVVSPSTVKWYNRQIFDKLGVNNRRQAVEHASVLRLLREGASAGPPRYHLPAQTTPFIGRTDELEQLTRLLDASENRLITVLAPGGMGKTRLALSTAEGHLSHFADGACFVPLTALVAPDQLVPELADAVGLQLTSDQRTPQQQLLNFLSNKELLLVLDNFEHLLDGATLLTDILEAAPRVRLLVTSRERLNLKGETLHILGGMTYPQQGTSDDILDYDAVQLFLECGERLGSPVAREEMSAVIQICQMTQGMPLALELAAAWLVALLPSEVADEIARGLEFLQANLRDIPERQRSIVAVFEASWRHLGAEEQSVFRKLAVFHGGFTRQAALAVAETRMDVLMDLANKALISRSSSTGRFEIHELLRQYAMEQLKRSGDLETTYTRHAAYFVEYLNACLPTLQSRTPQVALHDIETDFDNIRQAVFHLLHLDTSTLLQNVVESLRVFFEADVHFSSSVRHPGLPYLSLRLFFEARAHFSGDATTIFRRALAKAYPPDVEVTVREGLGDALHVTGAYESARQEFERAQQLLPPNAFTLHARLLRKRALTLDAQRRLEEALHVLAEAEETLDHAGERDEAWWHEWIALQNGIVSGYFFLGLVEPILERTDSIRAAVEQYGTPSERFDFYVSANMISLLRTQFVVTKKTLEYAELGLAAALESGGLLQIAVGHFRLGLTYFCLENWLAAEAELHNGLSVAEQIGNVLTQALCATFLALLFRRCSQVEVAEQWANMALQISANAGIDLYVASAKANLAWVAWGREDIEQAVLLATEAMAIWQRVSPNYPVRYQAQWILLADALRQQRFEDAVNYARELFEQQMPNEQVVPPLKAAIQAWDAGKEVEAQRFLLEASTRAASLGYL
jgi:predicted ATPase/DNA-binding CsgD family transcriptional regulator